MSSALKSGVKSTKSTGVDDGFQKPKKDIGSIVGSGTITNDSMMQQIQNLDISSESKKFLSSRQEPNQSDANLD